MPFLPGRRGRTDNRPIPAHAYRDTALVYAGMGVLLVIVATLTGGQTLRAIAAAAIFWALATAWTCWGWSKRIRARDEAEAAEAAEAAKKGLKPGTGKRANGNGRGNGNGQGRPQ